MSPRQVSSVVLMETLIVGVIALVVGLGLGFLISQAIAFATAGLSVWPSATIICCSAPDPPS